MECLSGLSRIMVCTRNDYTKRACHFPVPIHTPYYSLRNE